PMALRRLPHERVQKGRRRRGSVRNTLVRSVRFVLGIRDRGKLLQYLLTRPARLDMGFYSRPFRAGQLSSNQPAELFTRSTRLHLVHLGAPVSTRRAPASGPLLEPSCGPGSWPYTRSPPSSGGAPPPRPRRGPRRRATGTPTNG